MSDEDPIRLREDPDASADVRELFEAARGERTDDAMLERVLAGVLAGGGGGGGGSGGAPLAKSALLPALGVGAGVATAIAIAVGTSLWSGREPDHALVSDAGVVTEPAIDAAVDVDASVEIDAAGATDAAVVAVRVRPTPHVQDDPRGPPDPRADFALMREVTAALEADPARALALANDHRDRFPDSPLAEEREADAILAMMALHRDASARTATFRARWPRSPHLRRIDAASGEH